MSSTNCRAPPIVPLPTYPFLPCPNPGPFISIRVLDAFAPAPLPATIALGPIEKIAARDEHVRESWIKAMEARIVRGELQKCHKYEGVNHYENCKELAEKYAHMIRDNAVGIAEHGVIASALTIPDQGLQDHRHRVDPAVTNNASTYIGEERSVGGFKLIRATSRPGLVPRLTCRDAARH